MAFWQGRNPKLAQAAQAALAAIAVLWQCWKVFSAVSFDRKTPGGNRKATSMGKTSN
jgi:hypothetical protein